MTPRHDELDNLLRDLPFLQDHVEYLVLKDLFQGLRVQCLGHLERSASIERAIGAEYVAMGNGLENLLAEPLAEFHDPLLVTGRTEMSAFA